MIKLFRRNHPKNSSDTIPRGLLHVQVKVPDYENAPDYLLTVYTDFI